MKVFGIVDNTLDVVCGNDDTYHGETLRRHENIQKRNLKIKHRQITILNVQGLLSLGK